MTTDTFTQPTPEALVAQYMPIVRKNEAVQDVAAVADHFEIRDEIMEMYGNTNHMPDDDMDEFIDALYGTATTAAHAVIALCRAEVAGR
jgi:hypothetical protein